MKVFRDVYGDDASVIIHIRAALGRFELHPEWSESSRPGLLDWEPVESALNKLMEHFYKYQPALPEACENACAISHDTESLQKQFAEPTDETRHESDMHSQCQEHLGFFVDHARRRSRECIQTRTYPS